MLSQPSAVTIRPIAEKDNAAMAKIIRTSLEEFGAAKQGTVYFDPTTDALFQLFQTAGAAYFVAEKEGTLVGGGGIYPTAGLPDATCELVKMYVHRDSRGTGLGSALIEKSLHFAKETGYKQVYLETMPELQQALRVYQKFGFHYLNGPLGQQRSSRLQFVDAERSVSLTGKAYTLTKINGDRT